MPTPRLLPVRPPSERETLREKPASQHARIHLDSLVWRIRMLFGSRPGKTALGVVVLLVLFGGGTAAMFLIGGWSWQSRPALQPQSLSPPDTPLPPSSPPGLLRFIAIGDFGCGGRSEQDVAREVARLEPEIVITVGDNRYSPVNTYDAAVGKHYCAFIAGARNGSHCAGDEVAVNRFFPSTGNHDYSDGGGIDEYRDYFSLPGAGVPTSGTTGSELYYDHIHRHVHFFVLDSDPDYSPTSLDAQQVWLQSALNASAATWKIVHFHHPPYSSGMQGDHARMQWPYAQWGAHVVISGHDHSYERIVRDGILYLVCGIGGQEAYPLSRARVPGSQAAITDVYGACLFEAAEDAISVALVTADAAVRDYALYNRSAYPLDVRGV